MILEGYDTQAMAFAAPALTQEWEISRAALGPVFSASYVGYMVGALFFSVLSDRVGRKKIILVGGALVSTFTLLAGFADALSDFLILRFLVGIGLGGAIPSAIALTAEYVPARTRATAIALLFVGYNIGAALGGFFAAWAIGQYGWPAIFYFGGCVSLLLVAGLSLALPESLRFLVLKARHTNKIAALMRRLAPSEDFSGVAHFTLKDERHHDSSVQSLFTHGRAALSILLWVACLFSFLGHNFLTSWLPTIYADAGLSVEQAVTAGALFQLGAVAGAVCVGRMLDRWGIGSVVVTFAMAAMIVFLLGAAPVFGPLLMGTVFFAGLFVLGGQIGLNAVAGTIYPTAIRATGAGWAIGIGRIGSIAGPIIGGILIGSGVSDPLLFFFAAIPMVVVAATLAILLKYTDAGAS
jgi:AAHS family 4-hydroxybenzoate transporter-like MFS transporter